MVVGRLAFIIVYLTIQVLLVLYAGIGWAVLLGYAFLSMVLIIPIRSRWLDSRFGRLVFGEITRPELEYFIRSLTASRSYRVTVIVTVAALAGLCVWALLAFNYRLAELF